MARRPHFDASCVLSFYAQTDLQGPTLEQYKPDAASMVFLDWSLVPWANLSHDSMRDTQRSSHRAQAPILIHTHRPPSEIPDLQRLQKPHGTRMRDRLPMIADLSCTTALMEATLSASLLLYLSLTSLSLSHLLSLQMLLLLLANPSPAQLPTQGLTKN